MCMRSIFLDSLSKNAMVHFSMRKKQYMDSLRTDAVEIGHSAALWGGAGQRFQGRPTLPSSRTAFQVF